MLSISRTFVPPSFYKLAFCPSYLCYIFFLFYMYFLWQFSFPRAINQPFCKNPSVSLCVTGEVLEESWGRWGRGPEGGGAQEGEPHQVGGYEARLHLPHRGSGLQLCRIRAAQPAPPDPHQESPYVKAVNCQPEGSAFNMTRQGHIEKPLVYMCLLLFIIVFVSFASSKSTPKNNR